MVNSVPFMLVFFFLDLEVFWLYSDIASAMLAAIKDDEFILLNFSETAWSITSLNSFSNPPDQLNIATRFQQLYNFSIHFQLSTQLINGHYQQLSNQAFMVFDNWHSFYGHYTYVPRYHVFVTLYTYPLHLVFCE